MRQPKRTFKKIPDLPPEAGFATAKSTKSTDKPLRTGAHKLADRAAHHRIQIIPMSAKRKYIQSAGYPRPVALGCICFGAEVLIPNGTHAGQYANTAVPSAMHPKT